MRSESLVFGERVGQFLRLSFRIGAGAEQRNLRGLRDALLGLSGGIDGRGRFAVAGPVRAVPIPQKALVLRVGIPVRWCGSHDPPCRSCCFEDASTDRRLATQRMIGSGPTGLEPG